MSSSSGHREGNVELYSKAINKNMEHVESAFENTFQSPSGPRAITTGSHDSESIPLTFDRDSDNSKFYDRRPRSNWVQRITVGMVGLLFAMLIVVIAISSAIFDKLDQLQVPQVTKVTTVYQSLGLPGYEGYSWSDVVGGAVGDTVNFYSYGGATKYNNWIDNWLAPRLLEFYDIKLKRFPVAATVDAVNQVIREIQQGYGMNNGSIDLIWINGINFATLKTGGYAYGPWANKVPNAENFDFESLGLKFDHALPTSGFEMPYNEAQVVFIYNPNNITQSSSIGDINKLVSWVKTNRGLFTYADPSVDYTGSAFIRHIFYSLAQPDYTALLIPFDESVYARYAPSFFTILREELGPNLYAPGVYPSSTDDIDVLFAAGKVALTLSYDVGHATQMVAAGIWNANSTASLVLTSGTIANTNFVLIPVNSAHKLGAVVAGNFIASAQAQFSRAQPEVIGALQSYSPSAPLFTTGWNDAFDYIDRAPTTPSTADLFSHRLAELSSTWVQRIETDWVTCVKNYVSGAQSYCG